MHRNPGIHAQPLFGARALVRLQKLFCPALSVFAPFLSSWFFCGIYWFETSSSRGAASPDEGDQCPVVAILDLRNLFLAPHEQRRLLVHFHVAPVRNEGSHAAHRESAALMTGLDQELRIGFEKAFS